MKRFFLLITGFSLFAINVFAVPLENLVSAAHAAQLRSSSDLIIETQIRTPVPRLLPKESALEQHVQNTSRALNPGMMVEALFLYKKPASFVTSVNSWDERQKLSIFNQTLAISTLTGIQYFSSSRGEMRTFYESSNIVEGAASRNRLPDPVYNQLPSGVLTLHARQRDLTFGENVYRYDYINTPDSIFFTQENITALNYGIITAVGRSNLRSIVSIIDCGDSILVYMVSIARASSVPGMGDRISNSFSNRAEAVLKWLTSRLDSEIFAR
ncbi:MAG: hypothetical protein FWD28_08245 [Treponema sp.]|nr:hypothetical protein [Treponema sp.]